MIYQTIRKVSTRSLIKDKTVLITGGSKGIGLSIAQKLSANGYNIILLARDEQLLQKNVLQLPNFDNKLLHRYIKFDLSNPVTLGSGSGTNNDNSNKNDLETVINGYFNKERQESIDVLINCAGMTQTTMLPMTPVRTIQEMIQVNLTSPIILSRLVSRNLLNLRKPGQIINISSIMALNEYDHIMGTAVYSATKMALVKFTLKLSIELAKRHIYGNVILPSLIRDTEIGQSVNSDVITATTTKEQVAQQVLNILLNDVNGEVITV